jgi:NitT/TauT family transport system substrate-binding protein
MDPRPPAVTRREALAYLGAAGAAAGLALAPRAADAEPPPETTTVRLLDHPVQCLAPQYVAVDLLKAEGLTDVRFVSPPRWDQALASGAVDVSLLFTPSLVVQLDAGAPIVVLAGGHAGCAELIGRSEMRSTRELKGKRVAVTEPRGDEQHFTSMFVAHVGLDPRRDIEWIVRPFPDMPALLADGTVDAFFVGPTFSIELRERKVGRVLVSTTTDKPWSQYFCCLLGARRDFARRHPVATKRVLRALLKANDLCAREPQRIARQLAERGRGVRYEHALQMLRELPYGRWRQYDAEDTLRFYALRLHEAGLIRENPRELIAKGADWRHYRELRRELKS